MYGDDDDQSHEWRVDRESGSINDREWETVGRGQTPEAAVQDAYQHIEVENPAPADVRRFSEIFIQAAEGERLEDHPDSYAIMRGIKAVLMAQRKV